MEGRFPRGSDFDNIGRVGVLGLMVATLVELILEEFTPKVAETEPEWEPEDVEKNPSGGRRALL